MIHYEHQLADYKANEEMLLTNAGTPAYRGGLDRQLFEGIEPVVLKPCAMYHVANDIINNRMQQCGIIYCSTVSECNKLCDVLNYMGVHTGLYYSDVIEISDIITKRIHWMHG